MPKKTKDLELEEIKTSKAKKATATTKKASTTKKTSTAKKTIVAKKTAPTKKTNTAKKASSAKKATATKKDASTKKATTTTKTTYSKKAVTANKTVSKKEATNSKVAKITKSKKVAEKKKVSKFQAEYYDLPFLYNKTVVKVLAQTPKMLFIYWEISDTDRKNLQKQFGENFFETTRPVLIVFNDTMHYSYEVDINDFANSWYLHIQDANCEYHVELGRRPIVYNSQSSSQSEPYIPYYVYLTSSNEMTAPNNKILFNPSIKFVRFKNVKTGQVVDKDINQFTFITNFGIFNVQDLYKYLFPGENFEYENIVLGNTSSGALSSSGMFSSQFK